MQSATADFIDQLPIDQSPATPEEIQIVDTIFKKQAPKEVNRLAKEFKDAAIVMALIALVLFFKMNIENLICRYAPKIGSSQFLVNLLIAFIGGLLFYFLKNVNLIKKKS